MTNWRKYDLDEITLSINNIYIMLYKTKIKINDITFADFQTQGIIKFDEWIQGMIEENEL